MARADPTFTMRATDATQQAFRSVKASLGSLAGSMNSFGALFGVAVGVETARRVIMVADNLHALQIRIKTATKDTKDHVAVWESLRNIAQSTGAELQTTVGTFQDLARVKVVVGATNSDIIKLTRTVNELGVIGGSTTEQLRFGMRQFNQAMSQPFFRAEEFNSLLENIPEVAARIAQGFKMDQGALRQMVIEGKLSSKEVFEKLLAQSEGIHEEMKQIPLTVGRSMSQAITAVSTKLAELDSKLGVTAALAKLIDEHITRALNPSQSQLEEEFISLVKEASAAEKAMARLIELGAKPMTTFGAFTELDRRLAQVKKQIEDINNELMDPRFAKVRALPVDTTPPQAGDKGRLTQEEIKALEERMEKRKKAMIRLLREEQRAIAQEEAAAQTQAIARALGYVNERDKVLTERELAIRAASFELLAAQAAGFRSVAEQTEAEQDRALQEKMYAAQEQTATGYTLEEDAYRAHMERMAEIANEKFAARMGLNEDFARQMQENTEMAHRMEVASTLGKYSIMLGAAAGFLGAFSANSSKLQKLQKNAALAQIAITLPPAIIESFKNGGGYPTGLIPAALMAAEGMRQIQAVRSAGSGGGVSRPGGGGGNAASQLPAPAAAPLTAEAPTRLTIQILGDIVSAQQFADRVVKVVKDRTDADEIFITAGSAQATEIRGGN